MSIEELTTKLQESGVENPDEVIKLLKEEREKIALEESNKAEIALAEKLVAIEKDKEAKIEEAIQTEAERLNEFHQEIIQQEISDLNEALAVAAEIRTVRSALEKIVEGFKEAGIPLTQVFESAAAAEAAKLEDDVALVQEALDNATYELTRYKRAFIVSEATRGLTDVARDSIIRLGDAIDESVSTKQFKSIIESYILQQKLDEGKGKKKGMKEEDEDDDLDSTVSDDDGDDEVMNEKGKGKKSKTNESNNSYSITLDKIF